MLTTELLQRAMPKQISTKINDEVVAAINLSITDPHHASVIKENILSYSNVMGQGRFKLQDYVNAVKFNSYRMMGDKNVAAWAKTFPHRYQKLKVGQATEKDISAHVAIYNKNKLVNLVYEQTLTPTHILNAGVFQEAINIQAQIMKDQDVSPKVRSDAANSLLTHLKRPEAQKVELDIGIKDNTMLDELKQVTLSLATQAVKNIEAGVSTPLEIAHQGITIEHGEE